MRKEQFALEVERGLALERPQDTIESVTATIIRELTAFDPGINLRKTGYFNHSFVPDLVATWPGDTGPTERFIYLKSTASVGDFLEDVKLVQENRPIVVKLDVNNTEESAVERIDALSVETNTLVTDASGLEEFIEHGSSDFVKLVSSALSQGGRGYLDEGTAHDAAGTLVDGFEGARQLNVVGTSTATTLVARMLTSKYFNQINRLMQAIWIGSGGSLTDYPGHSDVGSGLSDEALMFLLKYDGIDDLAFWRRIALWTSVSQLGRLDLPEGSPNLQRLITAGSNQLWARSCRVVEAPQESLMDQEWSSDFVWRTDRDFLALRGPRFVAYLSEMADRTAKISPPDREGATISELQSKSAELVVHEADLISNGQHLNYFVEAKRDIRNGEKLAQLAAMLGSSAVVRRVVASHQGSMSLQCDFTTQTANGITRSQPPLVDIVKIALLAFVRLDLDDHQELDEVLGVEERDSGMLF